MAARRENLMAASQFALAHNHPAEALVWAQNAVSEPFVGQADFMTVTNLADAQEANGKTAEAAATQGAIHNRREPDRVRPPRRRLQDFGG